MHMVIANAAKGDPYPIDVLFMYMANMSWNSAMNVPDTIADLTAEGPTTATTAFRTSSIRMPIARRWSHYADLILPDTTYLERWDCISLLDRPISEADGPADSIRQPVVEPDRDVRPFQDVLLDLGARLGASRHDHRRRPAALSGRLCRLHRQPRARTGDRPARWISRPRWLRGRQGRAQSRAAPALYRERLPLVSTSCRST